MNKGENHLKANLDFLENQNPTNSSKKTKDAKKNTKEVVSSEVPQTSFPNVRPWVRFLARNIDNYVFAFVFAILWGILLPFSIPKSAFEFGMTALFVWIFFESIFLSSWGTTFGKWLLKVKVRDNEDKKLTFPIALKRSFLVWLKGLGIGFPVVSLFALALAHGDLTKRGITTWDKDCHLTVTYQKIGVIRVTVAILIIGTCIVISIGLKN